MSKLKPIKFKASATNTIVMKISIHAPLSTGGFNMEPLQRTVVGKYGNQEEVISDLQQSASRFITDLLVSNNYGTGRYYFSLSIEQKNKCIFWGIAGEFDYDSIKGLSEEPRR